MIRFEVVINDEPKLVVGLDEMAVLSAILTYKATKSETEAIALEELSDDLHLSVGGLITHGQNDNEHLDWVKRSLTVGDTVTIRIVDSDQVTAPIKRERSDPDLVAKAKRRYYESLKQEYGET